MKPADTKEIVDIGRRLAVYGTYICNRRHSCPQSHICSFLVCPSHHREHSSKPEVSITVCDSQQARRQR